MISKFALFCNLLLTAVALAVPSSQLWDHIPSRHESGQSGPVHDGVPLLARAASDNIFNTLNWAGAVMTTGSGAMTAITGTFTVPSPSSGDGAVSIGVGIDGRTPGTCSSAILQTGARIETSNSVTTYTAWFQSDPDDTNIAPPNDITISPNDVLTATVAAYSPWSGHAIIENHNTNQTAKWELSFAFPLCQVDAEWIVQAVKDQNGVYGPLMNFGNVTFTDAGTTGPNFVVYTPSEADIAEMATSSGLALTTVSPNGNTVTISYI